MKSVFTTHTERDTRLKVLLKASVRCGDDGSPQPSTFRGSRGSLVSGNMQKICFFCKDEIIKEFLKFQKNCLCFNGVLSIQLKIWV